MVGYYPEIFTAQHYLWAGVFFISTFLALLLANAALLTHLRYSKWTAFIGLIAVAVLAVFIAGTGCICRYPGFRVDCRGPEPGLDGRNGYRHVCQLHVR